MAIQHTATQEGARRIATALLSLAHGPHPFGRSVTEDVYRPELAGLTARHYACYVTHYSPDAAERKILTPYLAKLGPLPPCVCRHCAPKKRRRR